MSLKRIPIVDAFIEKVNGIGEFLDPGCRVNFSRCHLVLKATSITYASLVIRYNIMGNWRLIYVVHA